MQATETQPAITIERLDHRGEVAWPHGTIGRYSFHAKIVPKDHPHARDYYGQVTALTVRKDGATAHLYHREIDGLPPHGETAEIVDRLIADLPAICFPLAD